MGKRTLEVLKVLREKAVEAITKHGVTQKQACKMFGFSPTTMTQYIKAYKQSGENSFAYKKRGVSSGDRNLLSREQERALIDTVTSHTPDELGLESTLWTSKVISHYIQKIYNVQYSERGTRNFMTRLGFSSQKPINVILKK